VAGAGERRLPSSLPVSGSPSSAPLKPVQNLTLQGSPRNPGGSWQCTNHHVGSRRASGHEIMTDRTQSTGNQIAGNRVTDGLRHDETDARRVASITPRDVEERVRGTHPATLAHRGAKVAGSHNPICPSEHEGDLSRQPTRKVRCDPCDGGRPGSTCQHACACGDGNREPSRDGDCSAGKFSCS
jgi:hypothetical protein